MYQVMSPPPMTSGFPFNWLICIALSLFDSFPSVKRFVRRHVIVRLIAACPRCNITKLLKVIPCFLISYIPFCGSSVTASKNAKIMRMVWHFCNRQCDRLLPARTPDRIIRPGKQRKNVLNSLPRPAEKLRRR